MGFRLNPVEFLGSSNESPCVKQVVGVSGSGKTEWLNAMIRSAARSKDSNPRHRYIIFDIKNDGNADMVEHPASTISGAIRQAEEEKVVVIHPTIEEADDMLEDLISWMFYTAQELGEEFSATLVIEESSTYIGSHAASIPTQVKRLATQGRSMGLSLILVNQRALGNKWTDTQSQSMIMFRLARPDAEMLKKRWGVESESLNSRLAERKFSYALYDLEELKLSFYEPINYTGRPKNPITSPK